MCLRPGIRSLWRLIVTSPICSWKGPCRSGKQDTIKAGLCRTLGLAIKQEKGRRAGGLHRKDATQAGGRLRSYTHQNLHLCVEQRPQVYTRHSNWRWCRASIIPNKDITRWSTLNFALNKEKSTWNWSQLWSWYIGTFSGHFPLTLYCFEQSIWFMTHVKIRLNKNYLPDTSNMYNIILDRVRTVKKIMKSAFLYICILAKVFSDPCKILSL